MFHQPKMTTLQLMCGVSRGAAQPPGVFEELAMASIPTTAHLQAFEAVARRRSFALAASELHLTASAVSHQVAKLEAQLGVRLFERSAHGVRLSRPGQAYLERVGGALAAIGPAAQRPRPRTRKRP